MWLRLELCASGFSLHCIQLLFLGGTTHNTQGKITYEPMQLPRCTDIMIPCINHGCANADTETHIVVEQTMFFFPLRNLCPSFFFLWVCGGGQEGQVYRNACRIPILSVFDFFLGLNAKASGSVLLRSGWNNWSRYASSSFNCPKASLFLLLFLWGSGFSDKSLLVLQWGMVSFL